VYVLQHVHAVVWCWLLLLIVQVDSCDSLLSIACIMQLARYNGVRSDSVRHTMPKSSEHGAGSISGLGHSSIHN
jgi:hypothetical protein